MISPLSSRSTLRPLLRVALLLTAAATLGAAQAPPAQTPAAQTPATPASTAKAATDKPASFPAAVFKSATCGCCGKWNEHMRANGFAVTNTDLTDVAPVKDKHGVPMPLRSCHTALIGGYVIEGHVPADVVRKLLRERPAVVGIAVPGMPMGSPGMEGPRSDAYQIVAWEKSGATRVYASR